MNDCKYLRLLLALLLAFALVFTTFSGCEQSKNNSDNKKNTSDTNNLSVSIEPPITTLPREEKYSVELVFPENGHVFDKNDPPPIFTWKTYEDFPKYFVVEMVYQVDYDPFSLESINSAWYTAAYVMDDYKWELLKYDVSVVDGVQKVSWRIKIDDPMTEAEPYYSEWNCFMIKN